MEPGAELRGVKTLLNIAITKIPRDLRMLLIVYGSFSILPAFLHSNQGIMHILIMIMIMIWAIVASQWDLIMGYAGVFTFANVGIYVIGAYASAMLTMQLGISPWLGILAGGVIAAGIGVLISLPCLRLKGAYVALLTFALHLVLSSFLRSEAGRAIGTGGAQGLFGIPSLSVGGYTFSSMEPVPWFYVTLGISLASLFTIYKIVHSHWGLGFTAVRDSETLAESAGVDVYRYKAIVFGITSFFTGLAGALYAHYIGVLSTKILGLDLFLLLMVMQVIGGMGIFPGALLGTIVVTFADVGLRAVGIYRLVIFGAMVVALVVLAPRGIMGAILRDKGEGRGPRTPKLKLPQWFAQRGWGRKVEEEKIG